MGKAGQYPAWQPDQDVDDSALVWRAAVRMGLDRRRSLFRRGGSGYGWNGVMGRMGSGSGGTLLTGPAADALAHAQQSAVRGSSPGHDASQRRTAALEFAASELLKRFDQAERARLRESGELPDWFPAELKTRAREIRKRMAY